MSYCNYIVMENKVVIVTEDGTKSFCGDNPVFEKIKSLLKKIEQIAFIPVGNFFPSSDYEEEDEDFFDEEDNEDDLLELVKEVEAQEFSVQLAAKGRLTIPAALVRGLGLTCGDVCYAVIENKMITFYANDPVLEGRVAESKVFRADKHENIRIRASTLLDAGFRKRNYKVVGDSQNIVLT